MPTSTYITRRENLEQLVRDKFDNNRSAFGRKTEIHQNQVNLFLTDNEDLRRNIGEVLARRIEEKLGLPAMWMDVPHASGASTTRLSAPEPSDLYRGIFRRDDIVCAVEVYDAFLNQLTGKISGPTALSFFTVATRDMGTELPIGEMVVVDTAVKAVSNDGIYVLQKGSDVFLRRVSKQLSGAWLVQGAGVSEQVDSMKGVKAAGKVVMRWQHSIL